jgi:molybdenum cofactor biosynthesis protein B
MSADNEDGFRPVKIAVITASDTRSEENDKSGAYLAESVKSAGHELVHRSIVRDDFSAIVDCLKRLSNDPNVEVVITTGGTGVTGRDVTPEALSAVAEKEIAGFGELFRWLSFDKIGTSTIQSRAAACITNGTYIFALPGSPGACKDGWDGILKYQLDIRHKPCNFAELLPRLQER